MRVRTDWLVGVVIALCAFGVLIGLSAIPDQNGPAGGRAIVGVAGAVCLALLIRVSMVGLTLDPWTTTVRDVLGTYKLPRADVSGLAVERVARGRFQRLVVVCADGRVIPASWTVAGSGNGSWVAKAAYLAQGFGPTQSQVTPTLEARDRLAADGSIPLATRDPGLTPQTVSPATDGPERRWLGWETAFVVTAFALPGIAAAVTLLARHIGGVGDLNDFDLPLKHHPGVSLFLLSFRYITTALVVPIAFLLLARTGQTPSRLGLTKAGFGRDLPGSVGLLAGAYAATAALALAFYPFSSHLKVTETNTHVPAYYLIYGLLVSATTAINEEVIVNGYFLTRLSQLGWTRWAAFGLSFAVRESYHVYYGIAFVMTMPFGYLLTRSFQKRGRLGRPILAHFAYDAILFSIAVLTS
ncbi:MAG TPA: CPBP family intramembrane glutamic endopeptidase [Mycobacteriales bacterium]|nr:CPBP family intramembrane glutamic endopeptidase [Mycobacteriales bacterium]